MSSEPSPKHPLAPRLSQVQEKLESARAELCDGPELEKRDTGELIRIEETLAIAAEAAKEAVSIRRKVRADRAGVAKSTEKLTG